MHYPSQVLSSKLWLCKDMILGCKSKNILFHNIQQLHYSPRAAHNLQCPHPEQLVNRVWFQWPCRWFLCLPAATAGRQYALVSLCYQYVWGFGHTSIVLLCWWVWRSKLALHSTLKCTVYELKLQRSFYWALFSSQYYN